MVISFSFTRIEVGKFDDFGDCPGSNVRSIPMFFANYSSFFQARLRIKFFFFVIALSFVNLLAKVLYSHFIASLLDYRLVESLYFAFVLVVSALIVFPLTSFI